MRDGTISRRQWVGLASVPALAAVLGSKYFASPAIAAGAADANLAGVRVYNIREFGAAGDGTTLDTKAVQSAIDSAAKDQGGIVLVPAGVFHIGTIELKSNVTLHISAGGTLLGSADGKNYYSADAIPLRGDSTLGDGNVGLIFAVNARNVTIEGPGTIDGNGSAFRSPSRGVPPPSGRGGDHRPHLMLFYKCENLAVRDVYCNASAYHCIRPISCRFVDFDGIHIHNRVNHNNDGFHFISSEYVNIVNCNVLSQDDACALFGSCKFITVTNSSFSTRWSVFRFGGGVAENIAVSNCIIYQCYGCPIKLRCGPDSRFENMSFSNLLMQDVTGPISIGLGPPNRRGTAGQFDEDDRARTRPAPTPGILRGISFNGLRATVTSSPDQLSDTSFTSNYNVGEIRSCIVLNGVGESFLEDISFNDIHITYGGGGTAEDAARRDLPQHAGEYFELGRIPAYGMYARNVKRLTLANVRFDVKEADLRPAVILDHVQDASIGSLNVQGNPQAESALRLIDTRQALFTASRVTSPAGVFMRVEGADSGGITIDGGDLSLASAPTFLASGALQSAVKLRA